MTRNNIATNRRTYPIATGAVTTGTVPLADCLGVEAAGTRTTQVTDQPGDIADFESCIVTIVGMWLGPGDGEDAEPSGREYHEYGDPQQADLVQLQDGSTQLVDERDLDVAGYEFLQLDIEDIDATLNDGESAVVEVSGEAPLTVNAPFDIWDAIRTAFTADFTPVRRGGTDAYLLQHVPDGIRSPLKMSNNQ